MNRVLIITPQYEISILYRIFFHTTIVFVNIYNQFNYFTTPGTHCICYRLSYDAIVVMVTGPKLIEICVSIIGIRFILKPTF